MFRKPVLVAPPASPWRAEVAASVGLAWPMVMTMVAVIVMETVDVLMIGRLGEEALAAAALALNAWFAFLMFGIGVVSAVSPLTAQAVALGDDRGVRRSARQGLWAGLMMGAPFALILRHTEPVLIALGQKPELAAAAQSYLDWMGPVLIVIFLTFPLRLTMASYGVTRPAMIIVWCGVPLNALFNYIFIFGGLGGPEMGLAGAGVATLLVDLILFGAILVYMHRTPIFARLELFARFWRADWPRFRQLLKIGLPAGAMSVLETGLFTAAAVMMGWVGTTELAAHMIAMQIMSITFMVPFGLSQAATIRIGLAAGARDLEAVRLRGRVILYLSLAVMTFAEILFWTLGETLTGLFLSADDPDRAEVVAYGAGFLAIAALFQLFDGVQSTSGGTLRGLNDAFVPMVLSTIGYWAMGVTSAYVLAFPLGLGSAGIWYGLLIGLAFCAIAITWRFLRETRSEATAFRRLHSDFDPEAAL